MTQYVRLWDSMENTSPGKLMRKNTKKVFRSVFFFSREQQLPPIQFIKKIFTLISVDTLKGWRRIFLPLALFAIISEAVLFELLIKQFPPSNSFSMFPYSLESICNIVIKMKGLWWNPKNGSEQWQKFKGFQFPFKCLVSILIFPPSCSI